MRIGVIPERMADRLALHSRRFPHPLFDVMGTMLLSRAVMAGVYFRVFDRLAGGPKTGAALAAEAGCNPHGMRLLLDALVACRYLERADDRYRNAPLAAHWLLSEAPRTLANFVRFNYDQWNWVSQLEEFIERGEARDIHAKLSDAEWRNYMFGLRDLATLSAEEVAAKLKLGAPPRSLLDVGGGHSHYAITLCRHYAGLRATVVDLEPAARIGQELVARAGLSDRIEFRTGHLAETPFGRNHDVAFIFNVLHHLDEETCRATLHRLQAALAPAGTLVIAETFRQDRERMRRDQLGSLMALFFGVTSRRETYEFEQVAGWVREVGFGQVRRQKLRSAPFATLLVATKEG